MVFKSATLTLATSLLLSCSDEEEKAALLKKYEAQKAVLADMEFTIERLEAKVAEKQLEDPSEEIKKLEGQIKELENRRVGLKSELSELQAQKKMAGLKLADYKRKYPIR